MYAYPEMKREQTRKHADVLDNVIKDTEGTEQRPSQACKGGVILTCLFLVGIGGALYMTMSGGSPSDTPSPPPTRVRSKPFIKAFRQPDPVTQVKPAAKPTTKSDPNAKPTAPTPDPKVKSKSSRAKSKTPKSKPKAASLQTRDSILEEFQKEDPEDSWKNCSYHFCQRKRRNPLVTLHRMSGSVRDAIMNAPSKMNAHRMQFVCKKIQRNNSNRINIQIWRATDPSKPIQKLFSGFAGTIKLNVYVKTIKLPDRSRSNEPWEMNRVNIHIGSNSFGIFGGSSLRSCNRWWYYNHHSNCIIGDERAPHKMHPFEHFLRTCLKMKARDPKLKCVFEGFQGTEYDNSEAVDAYLKLFFGERLDQITPYRGAME